MKTKLLVKYLPAILFGLFILFSGLTHFSPGIKISKNFSIFFVEMITLLPFMFILIGIFDVWFPREKVEKYVGKESGVKGSLWMILLAMLQAGPLYGAFPVTYLLWSKGCNIKNIFIYLGAFTTLKIPMLTFEIGFLGLKFSVLRSIFTLPVFILIAIIMERYLRDKNFVITQP